MKKTKIILLLLLGFALGVIGAAAVYYFTVGQVEWQIYVEEKLIPNAVLALSSISALCVAALPIISKIQAAVARFDQATDDVNTTYKNDKQMLDFLSEHKEEMEDMMTEFRALRSDIEGYIEPVRHTCENTEQIARIGFCNTSELVKNGFAHEIAMVGKNNEQYDTEAEENT